jgi:5'-3' exonuclease
MKEVLLSSNECINEDFKTEAAIAKLPEVLSQNCGFCEKNADLTNCELQWKLKGIEESLMEKLKTEFEPMLRASTENLKIHKKLVAQMEETFTAKTENFENLIQFKLDEIEKLRDKLEASQSENNDKNAEIKRLKLKLEIFENNFK